MSKLDGAAAFDNVMDRLIDAEKRAHDSRQEATGRDGIVSALRADAARDRTRITMLEVQAKNHIDAEDAAGALYGEIDKALQQLPPTSAASLLAAMNALKKFIDPIPF